MLGKYKEILGKYKEILGKYKEILGKYKEILGKYKDILGKYKENARKDGWPIPRFKPSQLFSFALQHTLSQHLCVSGEQIQKIQKNYN